MKIASTVGIVLLLLFVSFADHSASDPLPAPHWAVSALVENEGKSVKYSRKRIRNHNGVVVITLKKGEGSYQINLSDSRSIIVAAVAGKVAKWD